MTSRQKLTEILNEVLQDLATARLAVIRLSKTEKTVRRCIQEEETESVQQTLAEATARYGELLERLATTNQPDEQPVPPPPSEEAQRASRIEARLKAPPPIELEMRTCEIRDGTWIAGPMAVVRRSHSIEDAAKMDANNWLRRLSKQLGTPLVPKWEGEEPKEPEMISEICDVCHERYECEKSNLPSICADCTAHDDQPV